MGTAVDKVIRLANVLQPPPGQTNDTGVVNDRAPGSYRSFKAPGPPTISNLPSSKGLSSNLALEGDHSEGETAVDDLPPVSTVASASLVPGMVVSHSNLTGGRPVQVVGQTHRGTHVEIMGKYAANGRGFLARTSPTTILNVHSMADISGQQPPGLDGGPNGSMPGQQQWSGPALGIGLA